MTALPDTIMPERAQGETTCATVLWTDEGPAIFSAFLARFAAAVAILASVGVWLMPVDAGDWGLLLIKLLFSVGFLGTAVYSITIDSRATLPQIQIDPVARTLTTREYDGKGHVRSETSCDFDALSEVVLRDGWMTAHDGNGRRILSLPVRDPAAIAAIRDAFGLARA